MTAERKRWLWSVASALLFHATVLWLLVGLPAHTVTPTLDTMQAIQVEMAPAPKAAPASPVAAAPGPVQHEQARQRPRPPAKPQRTPPIPALPTKATDASVSESVMPDTTSTDAAESANAAQRTTAPTGADGSAPAIAAARQTSAGSIQSARTTWESVLLGHLAAYRRYPPRAERSRQQGTAYVGFTVDRAGNVLAATLERSTGHALLDEETLATVRRASPLPPPPPDVPGDPVSVVVPVVFRLRSD